VFEGRGERSVKEEIGIGEKPAALPPERRIGLPCSRR